MLSIQFLFQHPRTLLLKRNIQSQRRIASVGLVIQRKIIYHIRVFSLDDKGKLVNYFSAGPSPLSLEKDEEKIVLSLEEGLFVRSSGVKKYLKLYLISFRNINITTFHEQPRRVSNLAQGFIIRWRINESACSNKRHIIVSSGDRYKSDTPNLETQFNISRTNVIINLYYPIEWGTNVTRPDLKTHIQQYK